MRFERTGSALLPLILLAAPLAAQDALSGVGPGTQVRKIEFRFTGEHALEEKDLRPRIGLTSRPGKIKRTLAFLPLIGPVGNHPFRPVELQRDVVRLRNVYVRGGYLDAKIDYDVRYDAKEDLVNVAFLVEEGPALQLRTVRFVGPDSAPPPIASPVAKEWLEFTQVEQEDTAASARSSAEASPSAPLGGCETAAIPSGRRRRTFWWIPRPTAPTSSSG